MGSSEFHPPGAYRQPPSLSYAQEERKENRIGDGSTQRRPARENSDRS